MNVMNDVLGVKKIKLTMHNIAWQELCKNVNGNYKPRAVNPNTLASVNMGEQKETGDAESSQE